MALVVEHLPVKPLSSKPPCYQKRNNGAKIQPEEEEKATTFRTNESYLHEKKVIRDDGGIKEAKAIKNRNISQ
jgi:hypothetical protein